MSEIYALYSTRDGRVRYVGRSGDGALRFKEHRRSAEWRNQSPLDRWFHQQWRDGYLVRYALLGVCDYDRREDVEREWIQRFPRFALLNERNLRPPWWSDPPKLPVVPEIVTIMRRYMFNVGDFRGVHYDRDTGYYCVLVYNGHRVRWLKAGRQCQHLVLRFSASIKCKGQRRRFPPNSYKGPSQGRYYRERCVGAGTVSEGRLRLVISRGTASRTRVSSTAI